ncbi:MAG: hypothetical protein ACXWEQ_07180 [Halobacteriota archaeon]
MNFAASEPEVFNPLTGKVLRCLIAVERADGALWLALALESNAHDPRSSGSNCTLDLA